MAPDDGARIDLPPDPVIEFYKKDIDRTLLRENLKLTIEQRLIKLQDFADAMKSSRGAARQR
jgi:hypothetical protein